MKSVQAFDFVQLMKAKGINLEEYFGAKDDDELSSQFFSFIDTEAGERILVESTVPKLMDAVLRAPIEVQSKIFSIIASLVTKPGDQLTIRKGSKHRAVRVVRLISEDPRTHSLLLTH